MEASVWSKQVLKEGVGVKPQKHQEVNLTLSMRYAPDQLICEGRQLFRIVIGRGDTLPALEEAISGMQSGEHSRITIPASLIDDAKFQKGKDLIVEVEIKSLGRVLHPDECSGYDYRKERAKELRTAGNDLMKEKKYQEASQTYRKGYELVELDTGEEIEQSKLLLLSNLSQSYLSCKDYEKCVQTCSKVLAEQPDNQKILYRRATGLKFLGRFDEAVCDAQSALKLSGGSQQFTQLLQDIRKHQQESLKKEKAVYSKMFG